MFFLFSNNVNKKFIEKELIKKIYKMSVALLTI